MPIIDKTKTTIIPNPIIPNPSACENVSLDIPPMSIEEGSQPANRQTIT